MYFNHTLVHIVRQHLQRTRCSPIRGQPWCFAAKQFTPTNQHHARCTPKHKIQIQIQDSSSPVQCLFFFGCFRSSFFPDCREGEEIPLPLSPPSPAREPNIPPHPKRRRRVGKGGKRGRWSSGRDGAGPALHSVHRLDKETSGVVLFACSAEVPLPPPRPPRALSAACLEGSEWGLALSGAQRRSDPPASRQASRQLGCAFANNAVKKTYYAVLCGHLPSPTECSAPLAEHSQVTPGDAVDPETIPHISRLRMVCHPAPGDASGWQDCVCLHLCWVSSQTGQKCSPCVDGKAAVTLFEPVAWADGATLCRVLPLTGVPSHLSTAAFFFQIRIGYLTRRN